MYDILYQKDQKLMELNSTVTAFDPISKSTKLSLAGRCLVSACGLQVYIFVFCFTKTV